MQLRVIMFCVFIYNEKAVSMAFGGRRTHEMATVVRMRWRPSYALFDGCGTRVLRPSYTHLYGINRLSFQHNDIVVTVQSS